MTDKTELLSRPKIAVDMDHVMADTGGYLTDWVNARFGLSRKDESFGTLRRTLPEAQKQALIDFVAQGDLMRDLPVMADCVAVMEALHARFCVVICTAAMEYPNTMAPKLDWLNRHFPFLDPHLFVFCGYKQVMGTDYLIDDSPKHFAGFSGTPLLYTAPHNHDLTGAQRVDDWADIDAYFSSR